MKEEISEDMAKMIIEQRDLISKQNEIKAQQNIIEEEVPTVEKKITSLGKAQTYTAGLTENDRAELTDMMGWKNIPIQILPSKGLFYVSDCNISIRAANVNEVRQFSTIDETDLIDVDDKLNMIIEKCTRIIFNGRRVSFKDLLELDRFYIVYSIRELTFKDGENKLQMNVSCPECGNSDLVEIKKDNFSFFEIPESLMRFYNEEERAFVATIKETGDQIKLYLPTLGVTNYIKTYVRKRSQSNKFIDRAFLKISPFLFNTWQGINDAMYDRLCEESYRWSLKKTSAVIGIIELLQSSINPEILHNCSSCSAEVHAPLSFQGGIKGLFLYSFDNSGSFLDELI